jgi:FixJ family two-component response regulator
MRPHSDHSLTSKKRKVIAVIDDDVGVLSALSRLLLALGYEPEIYASARAFLDSAITSEATCIMVDIQLGESSGIDLAQHLIDAGLTTPIILMSAEDSELFRRRATEIGCVAFLRKPFSAEPLIEALIHVHSSLAGERD